MMCLSLRKQAHIRVLSRYVCFIFSLLILSACVTVEKHQLPPGSEISKQAAWEVHRSNIEAIKTWGLNGRVAGKSGNEGFSAGVHWKQLQHNYVIDLHDPLGRKVAVIAGKVGNVNLKTSKGESFQANDPEELMQRLFGYSLPVNGLSHWLLGIPDPDLPHSPLVLDEHGRLMQLKQAGWSIDYKRYYGNPVLPTLMQISNVNLSANIKVDRWTLGMQ